MQHRDLLGAAWRKSSFSGEGESCVEVASMGDRVAARDSKNLTGPTLTFKVEQWRKFLAGLEQVSPSW
ncbi:DUF397 domain-containing protein [Saccharothrix sp. NRRL B-16314]|uniref:DUF397 domain-containing protein n=1 Tax=Saccharothrix sp. NRRL B-16314 TaxID=1463825 RepID=UPI000527AFDA|nr:DUF397 domain-containing protein [Saccharothrix sp. NRRL B-16314]